VVTPKYIVGEKIIESSLVLMLEKMWYWPENRRPSSIVDEVGIGITQIDVKNVEDIEKYTKLIFFAYGGESYLFEFVQSKFSEMHFALGEIGLYQADKKVLAMEVKHDFYRDRDYSRWSSVSIDLLETSIWIEHVQEIAGKMRS
jgi:hypothetical protein